MQTNILLALVASTLLFYGCESDTQSDDTKIIDPRKPIKPEQVFYGDSVYLVSKHIDTVYSYGQWIDKRAVTRKHRLDSIQRAKANK